MAATIQFRSSQTANSVLHEAVITGFSKKNPDSEFTALVVPVRPTDIMVMYGKVLAKNGTAWAYGRDKDGNRLIWKTVRISNRFARESYRMRSVPGGYVGDFVTCWARNINGKTIDFSKVSWAGGKDGFSVIARHKGEDLHRWDFPAK